MNQFSSSDSSNRASLHFVLGNWLDAVTAFEEHFYQLDHSLVSYDPTSGQFTYFVSQCSHRQASDLLVKMCRELEALVNTMNNPIDLSGLVEHTNRLNVLTNQASVLINLLTQSSC